MLLLPGWDLGATWGVVPLLVTLVCLLIVPLAVIFAVANPKHKQGNG
jgi:hypothetical protein